MMKLTQNLSIFIATLFISLVIVQCSNDEGLFQEQFDDPIVYSSLEEVKDSLTKNDTISFPIDNLPLDTTIVSPQGIRLVFTPAGSGNGDEFVLPLSVNLVEVYTKGEIIAHSIQTLSSLDEILVSGGLFWFEVVDAVGTLYTGFSAEAFIPYQTDAEGFQSNMSLHYAVTTNNPNVAITWFKSPTSTFTYYPDVVPNGEFHVDHIQMGWNGVLNNFNQGNTQFKVKVNNVENYSNTKIYFAFDDFTVVKAVENLDGDKLKTENATIPVGTSGKIIAISLINNQLAFASKAVTISGDDEFDITVQLGTIEELQALLESLD